VGASGVAAVSALHGSLPGQLCFVFIAKNCTNNQYSGTKN
jgi:hypothetical protein